MTRNKNFLLVAMLTLILSLGLACGGGPEVTPTPTPTSTSDSELVDVATEFVNLLVKEDFASAFQRFDSIMKGVTPEDELRSNWTSLVDRYISN